MNPAAKPPVVPHPPEDPDVEQLDPPATPLRRIRQKQRRLNDQQRADLTQAYLDGTTRKQLAAHYDINPTTVDAILTRAGIERRNTRITPDETTLAVHLYEQQHMSCARIGERLGYDPTTIWKALRNRAVRLRDTQGADR